MNDGVRVAAMLAWLGALGGCAISAPPEDASTDDTGCDVPAEECERLGLYHGECAGTGGPVLACNEGGRCAWYTGGCPVGSRASDCPTDDVCCHEREGGRWPYADWAPSSAPAKTEMISDLAAMGSTPVDGETPREIAVTLDPTIEAPADGVEARCSPENPLWAVCEDRFDVSSGAPRRTGRSLVVRFALDSLAGQSLSLEIVEAASGPIARIFLRIDEDASSDATPAICAPFQPRFTSGTLRLSALDESAHGRLRGELPDGHWVELDF